MVHADAAEALEEEDEELGVEVDGEGLDDVDDDSDVEGETVDVLSSSESDWEQAAAPTISASAAISTVKKADEIIRPPAPERGSRLMLALAITAGAMALALVGVLIGFFDPQLAY